MSFLKENKGLAAYLFIAVAATIALVVLLFLSLGEFKEVSDKYESARKELSHLQSGKPYPNQENLAALKAQKTELEEELTKFRTELSSMEFSAEEMSPSQFQDYLRLKVTEIVDLAAKNNVLIAIPEDQFYLGFARYRSELPRQGAVPLLARQLAATEYILKEMIESRVAELRAFSRKEFPEESRDVPASEESVLMTRDSFDIEVFTDAGNFRQWMNKIAQAPKFLVVRSVVIENEKLTGPERISASAVLPVAPVIDPALQPLPEDGALPTDVAAPVAPKYEFVVGKEKLKVSLRIEAIDFTVPATAETSETAGAEKAQK